MLLNQFNSAEFINLDFVIFIQHEPHTATSATAATAATAATRNVDSNNDNIGNIYALATTFSGPARNLWQLW